MKLLDCLDSHGKNYNTVIYLTDRLLEDTRHSDCQREAWKQMQLKYGRAVQSVLDYEDKFALASVSDPSFYRVSILL